MSQEGDSRTPNSLSQSRRESQTDVEEVTPQIDQYEIMERIGSRSLGTVFRARFVSSNRVRSVTVVTKDLAANPSMLERFSQEAKALIRLEHPNIVRIYEANAAHQPPYLAMQMVPGQTLKELLSRGSIPFAEATRYFEQIASALDYAHGLGFIHQDLTPENVIITPTGIAMLTGFGITSILNQESPEDNSSPVTMSYLAPELCLGKPATFASDIWAFAVMICQTLTGELPFRAARNAEVRQLIVDAAPAFPQKTPPRLRRFLERALDKDPQYRHRTAQGLVADLRASASSFLPKVERTEDENPVRTYTLAGVGAVVIAATVGLFYYAMFLKNQNSSRQLDALKSNSEFGGVVRKPNDNSRNIGLNSGMQDLEGAWFADLGQQFAELLILPKSGNQFKVETEVREDKGVVKLTGLGQLAPDGKKLTYREESIVSNPNNLAVVPNSFEGIWSDDHRQISGKNGSGSGIPFKFVRAEELTFTSYANGAEGFKIGVPPGWASTVNQSPDSQDTVFTPVAYPGVSIKVSVSPLSLPTIRAYFVQKENDLRLEGGYTEIGIEDSVTFAGAQATLWNYRIRKDDYVVHKMIFGVIRGANLLTMESSVPSEREELWGPVLEAMRSKFQFLSAG